MKTFSQQVTYTFEYTEHTNVVLMLERFGKMKVDFIFMQESVTR